MTSRPDQGPRPRREDTSTALDQGTGSWCRAAAVLDTWVAHDWSDGMRVDAVAALDTLYVRTLNTTYELTVLSPESGEVLVRGGKFFPERTRAHLAGSSLGGSFLKLRTVCPGFSMEIYHARRRIVTSRVQAVVPAPTTSSIT
jgi:hypothetical protein